MPGPPDKLRLIDSGNNFIVLQARLSSVGTPPILSAFFVIRGPEGTPSSHLVKEQSLAPGALVTVEIGQLSPGTNYSVSVYATNALGNGLDSETARFSTSKN